MLFDDKTRVCFYALIEGDGLGVETIEALLRKTRAYATVESYSETGVEEYNANVEFTQVKQRTSKKQPPFTAKIHECVYAGPEAVNRPGVYAVSKERIEGGNVSYWEISGEVKGETPLYNIHGALQSERMDIADFDDHPWRLIGENFTTIVTISYDDTEPTYEEVVELLRASRLSCTFSPEPMMDCAGPSGDMGPYYYLEFDLSAL